MVLRVRWFGRNPFHERLELRLQVSELLLKAILVFSEFLGSTLNCLAYDHFDVLGLSDMFHGLFHALDRCGHTRKCLGTDGHGV